MVFWAVRFLFACLTSDCHQYVSFPLNNNISSITGETFHQNAGVRIEQVSTRKRALDVKCFRGFSLSVSEYISSEGLFISEDEAMDRLMEGYDENGEIINHLSPHEREVYFAAVYCDENPDDESDILRKKFLQRNGVVGVVSAQIRNRKKSYTKEILKDCLSNHVCDMNQILPFPHVFLANMKVDECMRRRGIASNLLSWVIAYAEHQLDIETVVLDVDNDNLGAIQLYEKNGFEYIHKNSHFGFMAKRLHKEMRLL